MTRSGLVSGIHGIEFVSGVLWQASEVERNKAGREEGREEEGESGGGRWGRGEELGLLGRRESGAGGGVLCVREGGDKAEKRTSGVCCLVCVVVGDRLKKRQNG